MLRCVNLSYHFSKPIGGDITPIFVQFFPLMKKIPYSRAKHVFLPQKVKFCCYYFTISTKNLSLYLVMQQNTKSYVGVSDLQS